MVDLSRLMGNRSSGYPELMKIKPLYLLPFALGISYCIAAPHQGPPIKKTQPQGAGQPYPGTVPGADSAKRLGKAGLITGSESQRLANDVNQGNQLTDMTNKMMKDGLGQQKLQGNPQYLPQAIKRSPLALQPYVAKWRLEGLIVGGKLHSAAVFTIGGDRPLVVHPGQKVDAQTKVVSVTSKWVVLRQGKKQITMSPW